MSGLKSQRESLYGTPSGLKIQNPTPVISKRAPTTSDTGYSIGTLWTDKVLGNFYGLSKNAAGIATWNILGSVSSTFSTLTAASFVTSTAATAISLSSGNVFTGTGSNAAVGFVFTPKGAGGLTLTTGDLTLSSGNLVLTSGNETLTSGNLTLTNGSISLGTAGNGLSVKSGTNARIGQNTLTSGTVTVANTSVTANTRVFLTRASKNGSTAIGSLEAVISAGVGFVITAYAAGATTATGDTSIVNWLLVESA